MHYIFLCVSFPGLGTDGATVMTGKKEGLTGHFLRQNPHLVQTHCSAHRLALCSEQAAENIPGRNIIYLFHLQCCSS